MRALFGVLLLANLVLWLWNSGLPSAPGQISTPPPIPANTPSLMLLHEASSQALRVAVEPASSVAQDAPAESVAQSRQETQSGDAPVTNQEGPAAQSAVEALPPVCGRIGPYADQGGARAVQGRIRAEGGNAVVEEVPIVVQTRYWVYLPRSEDRNAARRTLGQLKALKIDSYLITEGERAMMISLGIFSTEAAARRLRESIRKQGFGARIAPRNKTEPRYWVTYRVNADGVDRIKSLQGNTGLRNELRPCGDLPAGPT